MEKILIIGLAIVIIVKIVFAEQKPTLNFTPKPNTILTQVGLRTDYDDVTKEVTIPLHYAPKGRTARIVLSRSPNGSFDPPPFISLSVNELDINGLYIPKTIISPDEVYYNLGYLNTNCLSDFSDIKITGLKESGSGNKVYSPHPILVYIPSHSTCNEKSVVLGGNTYTYNFINNYK